MEDIYKKQEIINFTRISNTELNEINFNQFDKLSFSDFSTIGTALSALLESCNNAYKNTNNDDLFRLVIPQNSNGKLMIKNGVTIGNIVDTDSKISARARFIKADNIINNQPISFNPTVLLMAINLANIDKKLNTINEGQKEIFRHLSTDKTSKIESDIKFLTDITNSYKYNYNDDMYKSNIYLKVLDIKQDSEHNVIFYQKQINNCIGVHKNIADKFKTLQAHFKNYNHSLYLYSFSSFLEVVLIENFDTKYLNSVILNLERHLFDYYNIYTNAYDHLEQISEKSVYSFILGNLSELSKNANSKLSSLPLINKTNLEKDLLNAEKWLENNKTKKQKTMTSKFSRNKDNYIYSFIKMLNDIDKIYNNSVEILFNNKEMYIKNI